MKAYFVANRINSDPPRRRKKKKKKKKGPYKPISSWFFLFLFFSSFCGCPRRRRRSPRGTKGGRGRALLSSPHYNLLGCRSLRAKGRGKGGGVWLPLINSPFR